MGRYVAGEAPVMDRLVEETVKEVGAEIKALAVPRLQGVVLEHGVDVKPPVLLQNNVWCARNVRFAGDVIVYSGTFIAEGTTLRRTVICGNTFIGTELDLDGKIVVGNRIIDAETGVWTDVEDEGIARRIRHRIGGLGWLRALWSFLLGRSRGRRY